MQFIIIHDDPKTNADLLAFDHLKTFQVREGIQIPCDIGHNLRVWWDGQYAPYSIWHAETRRFMLDRAAFTNFYRHLMACTERLANDRGTTGDIHKLEQIYAVPAVDIAAKLPERRTPVQFVAEQIVRTKRVAKSGRVRMTQGEVDRYMAVINNPCLTCEWMGTEECSELRCGRGGK